MRQWVTMAALAATALTGCTNSAPDAQTSDPGAALLQKAEAAASQTDYEGLMISDTASPEGPRRMEIMCYFRKPGLSRYEYRTGPARGLIVVQDRNFGWRYEPALKHFILSPSPGRSDSSRKLLIEQNYHTVVQDHKKVAGRDAEQIDVLPKRSRSPWRRFWIDSQTYIVLGQEHFGPHGLLQTRSQFQYVAYKREPESLFSPPGIARPLVSPVQMAQSLSISQLQHAVGFPLVSPGWLPRGYHSDKNYLTRCEDGCGAPVALTRFTDGVDSISIFHSQHVTDRDAGGSCKIETSGNVREARIVKNNIDYVVVGDLEAAQLRRIAQSIPSFSPPAGRASG